MKAKLFKRKYRDKSWLHIYFLYMYSILINYFFLVFGEFYNKGLRNRQIYMLDNDSRGDTSAQQVTVDTLEYQVFTEGYFVECFVYKASVQG